MPNDSPMLSDAITNTTVTLTARQWSTVVSALRHYTGLLVNPENKSDFAAVADIDPSSLYRSLCIKLGLVNEDSDIKMKNPYTGDVIE